ncbi:hypothetical protein GCM10007079_06610 [Nocardiopsis terrae]|uniref:Uncharacterized protein n=1 Tax=Nocardiopsis terrae TaxID=372655 RepID=A0ABR9HNV8_9ACTN|nr:hypothetical protein [Nocardiopsis terrae]MBE1460707.1 hypothetical protein [Nocardiopsis terrae]GHC73022.1 hypothetical protein GCM10007079_06610 [Nocardiopsis terrae]
MLTNDAALIVLGAAISLVTSVVVTAVHARQIRRSELRTATRTSARNLTSAFIAERDGTAEGTDFLSEAELTVMSMTDRKARERLGRVVRLLREHELPEVEQLSGVSSAAAKRVLCDHALDVLGAHLRADRLPEVPDVMRRMLNVEEEALSIHSGEAPRPSAPIEKSPVTPRPRHTGTAKTAGGTGSTGGTARKTAKTAKTAAKPSGKSGGHSTTATEEEPKKESAFWDD